MTNKSNWTVLSTDGVTVTEQSVSAVGPHYAAMLTQVSSSLGLSQEWKGVIVKGEGDKHFTVTTLFSPNEAYMAVNYRGVAADLDEEGLEVATFLSNRTEEGSTMHRLTMEHLPWLDCALPMDLLDAFPLLDDDGNLEQHRSALRRLATAIAIKVEDQIASSCEPDERDDLMKQLQMAAYMELRPSVLLALLLAGAYPQGVVSRITREHLMEELELY